MRKEEEKETPPVCWRGIYPRHHMRWTHVTRPSHHPPLQIGIALNAEYTRKNHEKNIIKKKDTQSKHQEREIPSSSSSYPLFASNLASICWFHSWLDSLWARTEQSFTQWLEEPHLTQDPCCLRLFLSSREVDDAKMELILMALSSIGSGLDFWGGW